ALAAASAHPLAFAVHDDRAAGAPSDACRMSAETGMLAPDLVGYGDRLDRERSRLQQLESRIVERPFDLDRTADYAFRLAQHAAERHRLRRVKARRVDQLARHRLGDRGGAVPATLAVVLAAGLDLAHEALPRQHDAVGNHLALGDGGTEPPGRADEHAARGRFAQAAARGARVDEWLNEHRHGGV